MADKRLNDLSTATDGAYIYAEDASGNQIKIAKADLATVVAGQLGITRMTLTLTAGQELRIDRNICGIYIFRSTSNSAVVTLTNWLTEGSSHTVGYFSLEKDTADKCNIYASNSSLYIQNLTSDTLEVHVISIGLRMG